MKAPMWAVSSTNRSFDGLEVWLEGCRAVLDEHERLSDRPIDLAALAQALPWPLTQAGQEHAQGLLCRVVCRVASESAPSSDLVARLWTLLARPFDERWCDDWIVLLGELNASQPALVTAPRIATTAADGRTARALDEIERRHADPTLRLCDVARMLAVSACRLTQLLKAETGNTFGVHVHRRRITHARALLDERTLSVKEIATRVGYQTTTQLGRQFKRHTSLSPSAYRRARTTPTRPTAVVCPWPDPTSRSPISGGTAPTLSLTKRQN